MSDTSDTVWQFVAGAILGAVGGAVGSPVWSALIVGALAVAILAAGDLAHDRERRGR